jgi:hypothetical protein
MFGMALLATCASKGIRETLQTDAEDHSGLSRDGVTDSAHVTGNSGLDRFI